jgi:phosphate transport system substrate-binding protein
MKKSFKIFILIIAVIFFAFGCGRNKNSITATGSTVFQPFAEKLADQYMKKNNSVNITVQGGGSAIGIQSVLSGASNIDMADLALHMSRKTY